MQPAEILASGWLDVVKGVVIAFALPTCGDATFDYFIVFEALAPAVRGIAVIHDAGFVLHFPARLFLIAAARNIRHLTIAAPRKIPAHLRQPA